MTRVVKIGGRLQADPMLPSALAEAARTGGRLVVVHGGGDEITALQRRFGIEPRFVGGRRVTTPEELGLVRMALSGTINKRIVAQLLAVGVAAVGISGEDGGLLPAVLLDGGALGAVGSPVGADSAVLEALLEHDFVPVVSPIGRDVETGAGLNVNGDDAAAAIAVALGARELLLLADVPGVLGADHEPLPMLDLDAAGRLVLDGIASGGMSAKLEAARRALAGGVQCVRIGGLATLGDMGAGTTLTSSPTAV